MAATAGPTQLTTVATQIVTAAAGRGVALRALAKDVYIGPSTVTASTGFKLDHGKMMVMPQCKEDLYAVVEEGAGAISVLNYANA